MWLRGSLDAYFPLFGYPIYHASTHLFFGDYIIPYATGMQQGDPLGPVLFSLAIHSLVKELVSTFNVWYLDDGTLGGSLQIVLADFNTILHQSSFLGLFLSISKCGVYLEGALSGPFLGKLQSVAPGISLQRLFCWVPLLLWLPYLQV